MSPEPPPGRPSREEVLQIVVDQYDHAGPPVTASNLERSLDSSERDVRACLDSLQALSLVAWTGQGWRPTTTARELLALDVDAGGVCVVDVVEDPDALED